MTKSDAALLTEIVAAFSTVVTETTRAIARNSARVAGSAASSLYAGTMRSVRIAPMLRTTRARGGLLGRRAQYGHGRRLPRRRVSGRSFNVIKSLTSRPRANQGPSTS